MKLLPILLASVSLILATPILAGSDNHDDHHHGKAEKEQTKHSHDDHDHGGNDHGHAHDDKPHHGGIVVVADGFHHELVAADGKLAIYIDGLPKGESRKAVTVRLTLLQGASKKDINLTLSKDDDHRFEAASDVKLAVGDKVVALIRPAKGKPRLVKFAK